MRSQLFLRRTRLLPKPSSSSGRALISYSNPVRYPRKEQTPSRNTHRRASSTVTATPPTPPTPPPNAFPSKPSGEDDSSEHPAMPGAQENSTGTKEPEPALHFPEIIFWPAESIAEPSPTSALPPPEIYEEALSNLCITLHPQSQYRAVNNPTAPPVEPNLALYCPIEGGDYIIDQTVRGLARQTKADVVVLDAVHLAAGEYGHFGTAASVLQFPQNPLHFSLHTPSSRRSSRPSADDDDESDMSSMFMPSQMTLQVMAPMRLTRASSSSQPPKGNTTLMKAFFDRLVNASVPESSGSPSSRRPRIIYVRDFGMLSPSSSSWYPSLLAAVRQLRQGTGHSSSAVATPVTIIFGITPPITEPSSSSSPTGAQGMMNFYMDRDSPSSVNTPAARAGKSEWNEDDSADKARERRLRERLRRWEKGDLTLHDELPKLSIVNGEIGETGSPRGQSGVVVIGGSSGFSELSSLLSSGLSGHSNSRPGPSNSDQNSQFFRTSVLVPQARSSSEERACRMSRRREINELTMRMAVGSVGGIITEVYPSARTAASATETVTQAEIPSSEPALEKMWDDWGKRVETWATVKRIADKAVGNLLWQRKSIGSLTSLVVGWDAIHQAWTAQRASRVMRKEWMQKSYSKSAQEKDEDEDEDEDESAQSTDEVVERVKRDPYLDPHEQKLLGCIVDAASMPTSFSQVHLPAHTIDAVRTIVSLPLLHPSAFQHGILKEHGMTGCLLFGPPGTGKTLVVRALAKEAGCRMLAISPSDVMDMFVGEGEKLVRSVFSLARQLSPCVVFIDEIDALFGARSSARETGGAIAHRGVITEFMQEMDGLKSSREDNVIVIGATNRPFDLDDAVLRRLPRRLLVDLPGEKEREEILKILLRDESLASDVEYKTLAQKTASFSGSDLKHLCVSAALDAVKENVSVPWAPLASSSVKAPEDISAVVTEVTKTEPLNEKIPSAEVSSEAPAPEHPRILHWHNFAKALKEITPSSSEILGSLAELRRWNEEFGEGRRNRKKQFWGKDRFGFTNRLVSSEEGRVVSPDTTQSVGSNVSDKTRG